MIDPKLLTAEQGFVEGCVVEGVRDDGVAYYAKFHSVDEKAVFVTTPFGDIAISMLEEIQSIHPLTGPMAIWNFAPDGSVALITSVLGIQWIYADDYKHINLVKRPFWVMGKE